MSSAKKPESETVTRTGRPRDSKRRPLRVSLKVRFVARHRQYGGYQRRTDREIPLVALEPLD